MQLVYAMELGSWSISLRSNVIGPTVIIGNNIGDKIMVHGMNLVPIDHGLPFTFQRR